MNDSDIPSSFEREKWQAEMELRRQELELKKQEQDRLDKDLHFRAEEARRSRWLNPLWIGILGAFIAAVGSIYSTRMNSQATQEAEVFKAESARILEVIKANDPEKAKVNLKFLIATGLVSSPTAMRIGAYLDEQPAGHGPVLPANSPATLATLEEQLKQMEQQKRIFDELLRAQEAPDRSPPRPLQALPGAKSGRQ